jgi:hypothetical protein
MYCCTGGSRGAGLAARPAGGGAVVAAGPVHDGRSQVIVNWLLVIDVRTGVKGAVQTMLPAGSGLYCAQPQQGVSSRCTPSVLLDSVNEELLVLADSTPYG